MKSKVVFDLSSVDSNAFGLMAGFRRAARRQGWSAEEIDKVLNKAKSGDYDNLVAVLDEVCELPEYDPNDDDCA